MFFDPVFGEIKKGVLNMFDSGKLSNEQTISIINLMNDCINNFYLKQENKTPLRCGQCLRKLGTDEKIYSLKNEIDKLTAGSWWSDDLDSEVAFDTVCENCCKKIINKYFLSNGE